MTASRDIYAQVWSGYFHCDRFYAKDPRIDIAEQFHSFFRTHNDYLKIIFPTDKWDCCYVDIQQFSALSPFPDFESTLVSRPIEISKCLGLALSVLYHIQNPYTEGLQLVTVRYYNLSQLASYADIKASSVGQLVCVEGHVSRVSPSRPMLHLASFTCAKCRQRTLVHCEDGIYNAPDVCSTSKCYNKYLEFDRDGAKLRDFQRLRLTEIQDFALSAPDDARVPRTLDIELRDSLVNSCIAGDMVHIVGIVQTMQV
jgi:DNA replicative helicase MCM subunit Mcm2 (Cdc46/Mcm family)